MRPVFVSRESPGGNEEPPCTIAVHALTALKDGTSEESKYGLRGFKPTTSPTMYGRVNVAMLPMSPCATAGCISLIATVLARISWVADDVTQTKYPLFAPFVKP